MLSYPNNWFKEWKLVMEIGAWTFICYDNIFSFVILAFMLKSNFICLHYSSIFINKMLLITFQTIILTTLRLIFIITNSTIAFVIQLYNLDRMRVCVTPKATAYREKILLWVLKFFWNEMNGNLKLMVETSNFLFSSPFMYSKAPQ